MAVRANGLGHSLLPMFIEFDTGTVPVALAAAQLLDYVFLAASGAVEQRWPQLNLPPLVLGGRQLHYSPPVVFVTKSRFAAGHRRLINIWEAARARYQALTLPERMKTVRPAILMTTHADLSEHGLAAPTLSLWAQAQQEGQRPPLISALVSNSLPLLITSLPVDEQLTIETDKARKRSNLARVRAATGDDEDYEDGDEI